MEFPVEIRLQIYDELMVNNVDLYRVKCPSCPERERYYGYDDSATSYPKTKLACFQLLMTSKQVYSEMLSALYTKNTIHLRCQNCEKLVIPGDWVCRIDPLDLTPDTIDHYYGHVRQISINFKDDSDQLCRSTKEFSARWLAIEACILAHYENIERISLQIQSIDDSNITFHLVRQSYKSISQYICPFTYVVLQCIAENLPDTAIIALAAIPDGPYFIQSFIPGSSEGTEFAVQTMRWRHPRFDPKEHVLSPKWYEHDARSAEME